VVLANRSGYLVAGVDQRLAFFGGIRFGEVGRVGEGFYIAIQTRACLGTRQLEAEQGGGHKGEDKDDEG
jgi:hypothetical protein